MTQNHYFLIFITGQEGGKDKGVWNIFFISYEKSLFDNVSRQQFVQLYMLSYQTGT